MVEFCQFSFPFTEKLQFEKLCLNCTDVNVTSHTINEEAFKNTVPLNFAKTIFNSSAVVINF